MFAVVLHLTMGCPIKEQSKNSVFSASEVLRKQLKFFSCSWNSDNFQTDIRKTLCENSLSTCAYSMSDTFISAKKAQCIVAAITDYFLFLCSAKAK